MPSSGTKAATTLLRPHRWARIMPKLYKARTVAWGRLRSGKAAMTWSVQASSGLRRGMGGPPVNTVVPITSCPRGENLMPRQFLTSYRVRKTPPSEPGARGWSVLGGFSRLAQRLPAVGQQLLEPTRRVRADPVEHIAEVRL